MARKESTNKDPGKGKSSVWVKTPVANLMRYEPKGTYYLRARVGGKIVRESLKTTDFSVAKVLVAEKLSEMRLAKGNASGIAPKTLSEALVCLKTQAERNPSLKPGTRKIYLKLIDRLLRGEHSKVPDVPLVKLTRQDMEEWWNRVTEEYQPQSSNHLLMITRRAVKFARDAGGIVRDPTDKIKPMRVARTRLDLPTTEQFRAIVASIRAQKNSDHKDESANWVEFMAYSGMRPAEVAAVCWEHIFEQEGVIMVHGGQYGTKNHESRPVPIIPPMADLLSRIRNGRKQGRVFAIKIPVKAFQNACKRCGVPHQRVYNLRHLFATMCRDAGVPVPTFAEWLGHKDGGALAMRTYVQKSSEHTLKAAQLVKFS